MTRINSIHPRDLSKKHLTGEYFELPRVVTAIEKKLAKGQQIAIPKPGSKYTLGAGHVVFFYDKMSFLYQRFSTIVDEAIFRGFSLNPDAVSSVNTRFEELLTNPSLSHICNDWEPDAAAMIENLTRLCEKEPDNFHYSNLLNSLVKGAANAL
jgi:hypothetical protein